VSPRLCARSTSDGTCVSQASGATVSRTKPLSTIGSPANGQSSSPYASYTSVAYAFQVARVVGHPCFLLGADRKCLTERSRVPRRQDGQIKTHDRGDSRSRRSSNARPLPSIPAPPTRPMPARRVNESPHPLYVLSVRPGNDARRRSRQQARRVDHFPFVDPQVWVSSTTSAILASLAYVRLCKEYSAL
jgi:hypothetical protein